MGSKSGENSVDLWSQIIDTEEQQNRKQQQQQQEQQIGVIYRRRRPETTPTVVADTSRLNPSHGNRMSMVAAAAAANNRVSWNRSLSTRGRTSVAVAACVDYWPEQRKAKRKPKPPLPKGKSVQSLNFDKERAYFQEVDSFELMEESPSPKSFGTWTMGAKSDEITIPHLSSVLEKWLISKKLNYSCGPSGSLSKILETPAMPMEPICSEGLDLSSLKTPEKASAQMHSGLHTLQNIFSSCVMTKDVHDPRLSSQKCNENILNISDAAHEDIEASVRKLSLTSCWDPFLALLTFCGQSAPSTFLDVLSKHCEPESIVKVGEGTYGEAFKTGKTVCKIVPIDGDIQVNGAEQKKSAELLEEVVLSQTLNRLRGHGDRTDNACTTFIDSVDFRVCQGPYYPALIKAWEAWDGKHSSENDHPKGFPEKQCFVVLVQEHGGQDLESFVLLNFDEARILLVQVTVALAVAEAAFEFEHRDLHWGNILLSRKDSEILHFTLEGKDIHLRTHGLVISIIDFTLSRMNTGEDILYLDLSLDPEIFEGPKGDRQSDTYRKMKKITEDCWEGSFPKTNVLWLQYLVDILLLKKSFKRTSKDERDLRSFKKRLNTCSSAKEVVSDPFFKNLFVDHDL